MLKNEYPDVKKCQHIRISSLRIDECRSSLSSWLLKPYHTSPRGEKKEIKEKREKRKKEKKERKEKKKERKKRKKKERKKRKEKKKEKKKRTKRKKKEKKEKKEKNKKRHDPTFYNFLSTAADGANSAWISIPASGEQIMMTSAPTAHYAAGPQPPSSYYGSSIY
uniref:Uncharacterized protein n=1 Tax=Romanomermis culicivorax TaxID=13658 RepID=A0A915JN25_ROMCU